MSDNFPLTPGTGRNAATDQVTHSGDTADVQLMRPVGVTGAEGSKTVVDIVDATFGLAVDVKRMAALVASSANIGDVDVLTMPDVVAVGKAADGAAVSGNPVLVAGQDGTNAQSLKTDTDGELQVDVLTLPNVTIGAALPAGNANIGDVDIVTMPNAVVAGDVAHSTTDSGNPVKVGAKAISHAADPTPVSANERTDLYANRHGILFTIGGHPNVRTLKHTTITTAVTDAAIVTAGATEKIVVTRLTITLDNASTVFPTVLIGFGTANTPTTTQVLFAHGGVPAGGGAVIGSGSGILGIGAAGEDLRVTTTGNATGNGLQITLSYFVIDEA